MGWLAGQIRARLHRDDRGALSVLILLTIFALVAMVALVWNTGEYAARRRHVQTAVDAAAQGASLWRARTTNLVAATNQLIAENASAEVIYRATASTINSIAGRLARERQTILTQLESIRRQRQQNQQNPRGPDPNLDLKLALKEGVLNAVMNSYGQQQALLQALIERTAPAFAMSVDEFAQRRDEMFSYQQTLIDLTPQVVAEQYQALGQFHQCELALATPTGAPAAAPIKTVDHTNVEGVTVGGVSVPDPEQGRDVWVTGGTWGEIVCPPLARFFNSRVDRDAGWDRSDSLVPILRAFDEVRRSVGDMIRQMLTPPANATPDEIRVAQEAQREIDRLHLGDGFAVSTFSRFIGSYRAAVLWNLGEGNLHALATYDRYDVADWAKAGVYQDAYQYVYNWVYSHNYNRLYRQRYNELRRQLDENRQRVYTDAQAQAMASAWASAIAQAGAAQIATQAASEWINRTWPYEIRPPRQPVPPAAGLAVDERWNHFTLLVAGKSTDATAARPFLPKLMLPQTTTFGAYAQSENFNWMEFSGGYGAGDRYDRRTPPLPWRVSTAGGWNWQPRLAFSDALGAAMENNEDFRRIFEDTGVTGYDSDAIKTLIMH